MRKMIAQKGTKTSSVKRTKKAQDGVNFDFDEKNRYAGGRGFASRFMSGAYEAQPYVKAKRADEARKAKLTPEERELEMINAKRIGAGVAGPRAGSKQRKGGKTVKHVKKAQTGAALDSSRNELFSKLSKASSLPKKALNKKYKTSKLQKGGSTKAKYGVAKKASSKRSK
jgi:hypothetical protein